MEATVAAADEVSILLLCVMKRSRSFMAGRKVMMIFSTWRKKRRDKGKNGRVYTNVDGQQCVDNQKKEQHLKH